MLQVMIKESMRIKITISIKGLKKLVVLVVLFLAITRKVVKRGLNNHFRQ